MVLTAVLVRIIAKYKEMEYELHQPTSLNVSEDGLL